MAKLMKPMPLALAVAFCVATAPSPSLAATNWVIYASDAYGMTPIQQLTNAVANVQEGDTITLKRGTYVFPDDVFMADNTRTTTSPAYCRFRLNVTTPGITIRGEDASSRKTWTTGS